MSQAWLHKPRRISPLRRQEAGASQIQSHLKHIMISKPVWSDSAVKEQHCECEEDIHTLCEPISGSVMKRRIVAISLGTVIKSLL